MGYQPKFGYTAWKNGRQDESHQGFKGYVFESGQYYVYINIHSHASNPKRYRTIFHTVLFVVSDKSTHEIMMELSVKADFGRLASRKKGGGFIILENSGHDSSNQCSARKERIVNVINPNNLDERFAYREKDNLLKGDYGELRLTRTKIIERSY